MHLEIEIVGNIGSDAILKETNGRKVINFSVAHSERYKKQDGTVVENTTWINCSYWDAEKIAPYLKKGTTVLVKGKPSVNTYQNKAGQHVADIRCQVAVLRLLSGKKDDEARCPNTATTSTPVSNVPTTGSLSAESLQNSFADSPPVGDVLPF
jgi:single-strand DNA-binding protein